MEKWRDIPGFEGLYQASTEGRIKSVSKNTKPPGFKVFYIGRTKEKIMNEYFRKDGRKTVTLYNGKYVTCKVHRLIAFTFPEICGEYFEGAEVNHLDENPTNNAASNLLWVSHTANINWGTHNERMMKSRKGKNARKPVLQYTLDGKFVAEYSNSMEAERQTGIDNNHIRQVCRNVEHHNSSGGYIWKYKTLPN